MWILGSRQDLSSLGHSDSTHTDISTQRRDSREKMKGNAWLERELRGQRPDVVEGKGQMVLERERPGFTPSHVIILLSALFQSQIVA